MSTNRHSHKIDSNGKYKKYYGVTIICPLLTDISEYHQNLSNSIDTNKYSILPIDSMHMTLRNLWTQNSFNDDIPLYHKELRLQMPHLIKLNEELKKLSPIYMEVIENYIHGVFLEPHTYDDAIQLANYEMTVDRHIDHSDRVKKHMTLAYNYNSNIKFKRKINGLQKILKFDIPKICTFDSMETYIPI
jgi:hypothetical protein